ncbi:MAG TPA: nitroreductase family deazaflavin-dependent oxidoreductase [Candidatus Dormibacteraeota bacterium]|jgi:deazaflavin-dependent oxidoreductase (nitroreductase family)
MSSTASDRFNNFNQNLIADLRANAGTATSGPFVGRPVLIMTNTGAKSGEVRETPVVYTRDGDNYVIIASKGGAPTNPDWYHNLVAYPEVKLEVLGETIPARARVAEGEEHDRLYDAQAQMMPAFADYQKRTTRKIPVFILEPVRST